MFWKREQIIKNGTLGPLLSIPQPPKKEFELMLELLRDAEKYDCRNEIDIRNNILTNLREYIEKYQNKKP